MVVNDRTWPSLDVIAYPGEITLVKPLFDRRGLFVWHCHILEHEDNEMMRPYRVSRDAPEPDAAPAAFRFRSAPALGS
jgi:Multicopper oxidase